jgi:hypothetical protein
MICDLRLSPGPGVDHDGIGSTGTRTTMLSSWILRNVCTRICTDLDISDEDAENGRDARGIGSDDLGMRIPSCRVKLMFDVPLFPIVYLKWTQSSQDVNR